MAKTYHVTGMSCGGCAASIERAIKAVLPSASVSVDLEAKAVTVDGADNDAAIEQAVDGAGFTYGGIASAE